MKAPRTLLLLSLLMLGCGAAQTSDDAGSSGGGGGAAGGGTAGGGSLNPDDIPSATALILSRDYTTHDAGEVLSQANLAVGEWGAAYGYSGPGWRFRPDPIIGTAENEDSAGWLMPWGAPAFPPDGHALVTVSFMLKLSGPLLDEIARGGPLWAHVNKAFDFKYWNAAGNGEGGRNGVHFGENPPQFHFSTGGAGQFMAIGPDWRTLADQWVWVCFVVDMRGATPSQRYLAAYYRPPGGQVQQMGRVAEDNATSPLQSYAGRGFLGFFSPLFGYWDDMNGRESVAGNLQSMFVHVDRVRIANGWPTGADGPP